MKSNLSEGKKKKEVKNAVQSVYKMTQSEQLLYLYPAKGPLGILIEESYKGNPSDDSFGL